MNQLSLFSLLLKSLEPKPLPTEDAPEGYLHGWYSAEYAEFCGTLTYENVDGVRVELIEVTKENWTVASWKDKKYVGLVKEGTCQKGMGGTGGTVRKNYKENLFEFDNELINNEIYKKDFDYKKIYNKDFDYNKIYNILNVEPEPEPKPDSVIVPVPMSQTSLSEQEQEQEEQK
jgi:hypothetical protein